jgi:hypothetical protein
VPQLLDLLLVKLVDINTLRKSLTARGNVLSDAEEMFLGVDEMSYKDLQIPGIRVIEDELLPLIWRCLLESFSTKVSARGFIITILISFLSGSVFDAIHFVSP